MQSCIYCRTEFNKAAEEHIIHAFLGARWDDGKLICDECQSRFATGIDTALSQKLQPFRLLLGTKGDHGGRTGSLIRNLEATSGETLHIGPHGQSSLVRPVVTITEHGDRHIVQIKIDKANQLDWALHEVRQLLPHAQIDRANIAPLGVQTRERVDGEVNFDLNLGGLDFFRGVLKSCVNLFAAHDPAARTAFLDPTFDAVRAFVLDGTGQIGDFARWMTMIEPLKLPTRGPADQTIILTTRGQSVEGVMRFFGNLAFAIRLTNTYSGPPIHCAYVVDPYREADRAEERLSGQSLTQYDQFIPNFDEQSPGNNVVVQTAWDAAINRFMAHYTERENEETARKVVDQTIAENPDAAAIDQGKLLEMVRELIRQRFEKFEKTGDATGITVLKTRGANPPQLEQTRS